MQVGNELLTGCVASFLHEIRVESFVTTLAKGLLAFLCVGAGETGCQDRHRELERHASWRKFQVVMVIVGAWCMFPFTVEGSLFAINICILEGRSRKS